MHTLRYHYKYSTESLESMMPWELDIELGMIASSLQKAAAANQG